MANKLTTLGYFLKRLRDSGYYVHKIFTEYSQADSRDWTVIIDPGGSSVFCTCYSQDLFLEEPYLELYDGGQYIPGRLKIKTDSFEVFVYHLVELGINNKAATYPSERQA
jgi:hypothetical protein